MRFVKLLAMIILATVSVHAQGIGGKAGNRGEGRIWRRRRQHPFPFSRLDLFARHLRAELLVGYHCVQYQRVHPHHERQRLDGSDCYGEHQLHHNHGYGRRWLTLVALRGLPFKHRKRRGGCLDQLNGLGWNDIRYRDSLGECGGLL